ncbi:hypothetical protein HHK36_029415 [Tetracentron sinense]|uniref:Uncharacterized protein n=1 Tax=Tetracentron sinense TaxID=13715 RepID=A0A834YCZ1_TETSI|nr:hypothetical protein HHK36_029415 [Tetracentron sinense]
MRGSRARTNFFYSDMPPSSSITSIISPDDNLFLPHPLHSPNAFPPPAPAWIPDFVSLQPSVTPAGYVDACGSHQLYDNNNAPDLPPLPSCLSHVSASYTSTIPVSGYDHLSQGAWNDTITGSSFLSGSEHIPTGFDSLGSGSSLDFDSGEFVHSPLFGGMPPVSDTLPSVPDSFELGSSSYFF